MNSRKCTEILQYLRTLQSTIVKLQALSEECNILAALHSRGTKGRHAGRFRGAQQGLLRGKH